MSLIHQVLQDLDERHHAQGHVEGYADEQENRRLVIWPAVLVSLLAAALVVYFSDYLKAPPAEVDTGVLPQLPLQAQAPSTNDSLIPAVVLEHEQAPVVVLASELADLEMHQASVPAVAPKSDSEVVAAAIAEPVPDAVVIEQVVAEPDPVASVPVKAEANRNASVKAAVVEPLPAVVKKSSPSAPDQARDVTTADVSVVRRLSPDDQYSKAVNRYRSGDWQAALLALEAATAGDPRIEFFTLQERIYLEQGMRDEFLALFDANSANQDLSWLSVVAPGLHMFGIYSAAIQQYGVLMTIQPKRAEWAIAQTQAQIDAGQIEGAKRNLRYLVADYELTTDQRRWVSYQQGVLR